MLQAQAVAGSGHSSDPMIFVEEITHRVVNEYTLAISGIRLAAASVVSPKRVSSLRKRRAS